jgi:eukaryotic-like serine/threonine-protein kinase
LISRLSAGGSGELYVARREGSHEICVLKTLRLDLKDSETASVRLRREAHLAAYLRHPNIARVLDAGLEDGTFYIATEHVPGVELAQILERIAREGRRVPPEMAIPITLDVLSGLEHAHDAVDANGEPLSVVHRDLGPRNIMISFDGRVKIIDFGSARGRVDNFQTAPGTIIGTPRYVSPEMVAGHQADRRSDLYSVAVVMFEMLTGRPLVPPGQPIQVLSWIATKIPPRLSDVEPAAPRAFDDILRKGLEKNPDDRWQTAKELREAIAAGSADLALMGKPALGALIRTLFPVEHRRALELIRAASS